MANAADRFAKDGYAVLPWDQTTHHWAEAALIQAREIARDPTQQRAWLRHGGTWFAGVDVLDNGTNGDVDGRPLAGPALDLIRALGLWPQHWHAAQISITYPGYPGADAGESSGAIRYRRTRDAAHLDGLHAVGKARRRMLREPHAFILGLPLTQADPSAAPLVAWPGSPALMADCLRIALAPHPLKDWPDIDLTEAYQSARREVFATCARIEITAQPGEAILLHRHMLHGIAPWSTGATAAPEGRMIAYFRPCFDTIPTWLNKT